MEIKKKSILIVEDQIILAMNTRLALEDAGYRVTGIAISGEDALSMVERDCPDMVLMDITLSGKIDGIDAAARMIEEFRIPVAYLTGNADKSTVELIKRSNHVGILQKPVEDYELISMIEHVIGN